MMNTQQEVDTEIMKLYATATIEDLQRGLRNMVIAVIDCQAAHQPRQGREALHHAELLRAEIARRQEVQL